jgi:glycosyltransferase involved in cell wall biosynthesis
VKVLLLHQHFNTPGKGGPLRSYFLATALIARGIWPIVITTHLEKKYRVEIVDGMEVHYLPVPYQNQYGFYRRTWAFLRYAFGAVSLARKFSSVEICYTMSVPLTVGLAAMAIRRFYKIPYIFEVGDLWPDAPIQMGFIKNRLLQKSVYELERRIYKNAVSIVALSEPIKEKIEKRAPGKSVYVIPNMADTEFFVPSKKDPLLEQRFAVEGKFVVSYIGAVGYANGLDFFLECARASKRSQLPVHFQICGAGAMTQKLQELSSKLALDNLSFIPFQHREGVREVMNVTDAVFVCYRPVAILETGSPNKYFDGLAAGKLILINFGGWIRKEIEALECGKYINPRTPEEFIPVITPFIQDGTLLDRYQKNARLLAEEKYSRAMLSGILPEIIQNIGITSEDDEKKAP